MKIRSGFVSNSSSSSFVILKSDMTEKQIELMKGWIKEYNDSDEYEEGYPQEGKKVFFGEVSYHASLDEFLVGIGFNVNKMEIGD